MTPHENAYVDGRDTDRAVQALTVVTAVMEARYDGATTTPAVTLHVAHWKRLHPKSAKAEELTVGLSRRGPKVGVHVEVYPMAWAGAAA